LSVPHRVGTTRDTIPAHVPYLAADPERMRRWDERLGNIDKLRVGIAWRDTPGPLDRAYKALPFAAIARLAAVPGVALFALPLDPTPHDRPAAIVPLDPARDLGDTAAVVANMDLVIAPDTMYCHLAGALGRPVWTLLSKAPDWRYQLAEHTTPWYPTMRLFRQTTLGRWDEVVDRVAAELTALVATVGRGPALR
jgi:hypothetical protein